MEKIIGEHWILVYYGHGVNLYANNKHKSCEKRTIVFHFEMHNLCGSSSSSQKKCGFCICVVSRPDSHKFGQSGRPYGLSGKNDPQDLIKISIAWNVVL